MRCIILDKNYNPLDEAQKICLAANNLAHAIRKKTNIQSKYIYYEEIFFFYFLNDVNLSINEAPVEVTIRIKPALLKLLSYTDSQEYKTISEYLDIFLCFRHKTYSDIMFKYSEILTPDFFINAFQFQSELIIYIQENNILMDPKQKPNSLSEWISKAAQDDYYSLIIKTLQSQFDMILDFMNI